MISVRVSNGEKHERNNRWYVTFSTVFILIIILSLVIRNRSGVIVMFFFLGAYLYYQILHLQLIEMVIEEGFLRIGNTTHAWQDYV